MKLLLDTATFLWILTDSPRLSQYARESFLDEENERYLSSVSAFEIALKYSIGRLQLSAPPELLISREREKHGIESLPLEEEPTLYLPRLPQLHADPFDRLLICQAIVHGMSILSSDDLLTQYPVRVLW